MRPPPCVCELEMLSAATPAARFGPSKRLSLAEEGGTISRFAKSLLGENSHESSGLSRIRERRVVLGRAMRYIAAP